MFSMLKNWQGKIEVNGQLFNSVNDLTTQIKSLPTEIHIRLIPANKVDSEIKQTIKETNSTGEIKITVKNYMLKKATPEFDFMQKWNDDKPMPLRIMTGRVIKETRGMIYMQLHGQGLETIHCMRCGRELTHPVSRHYGIGPECMQKVGMFCDIDDISQIKEKLVDIKWEGWIIRSAIIEQEEV